MCAIVAHAASLGAQNPPTPATRVFQKWIASVEAHEGGQLDEAVLATAQLRAADREMLWQGLVTLLALMQQPDRPPPHTAILSARDFPSLRDVAMRASARQSVADLVHRAVILHTDAAVLAPDVIQQTVAAEGPRRVAPQSTVAQGNDGQLQAMSELNWHFDFARHLIDQNGTAKIDPFAAAWYHAVAVYQLEQQFFGEAHVHLDHAALLFPRDARILLDRASYSEALGAPTVQVFVRAGTFPRGFRPAVPAQEETDATAIKLFRQALDVDQNLAEARVRLARLLEAHGHADDALQLLTPEVLAGISESHLLYFARMTAGRAAAATGRSEEATTHYRAAQELFPTSQAPALGLSLLALRNGDIDAAVLQAGVLRADRDLAERDDPWWDYFGGHWRGAAAALDAVRKAAVK